MNSALVENRISTTLEALENPLGQSSSNSAAKLDSRFIHNIKGKEFVLYAGLLDLAHQKGLQKFEVELIQFPTDENHQVAICRASLESKTGERFTDIGDADPSNVTQMIVPHLIRMASTRAKARAMRDFCNIGLVCLEELGEIEDVIGNEGFPEYVNPLKRNGNGNGNHLGNVNGKQSGNGNGNGKQPDRNNNPSTHHSHTNGTNRIAKMSEAQNRAILNLAKRRNISDEELSQIVQNDFQTSLQELSIQAASQLIQTLQKHS
jgi:hypothetical protein